MFNIDQVLADYGMTAEKYENLLAECSSKVAKISDLDWTEICEKYGIDLNPDTVRKGCQPPLIGSAFVYEYFKSKEPAELKCSDSTTLEELRHEIRKEKQRLFDERAALNKTLRDRGREEENIEILKRMIEKNGRTTLPPLTFTRPDNGRDLIVCLSDLHLGLDVRNQFGAYNSKIAEERLNDYADQIVEIGKANSVSNVYLILLGDLISGEIHMTTQLENRENLTEQVQTAAELVSAFTYKLAQNFNYVYVNSVAGNHSRTDVKDKVLRANRLDNLIPWYMKAKLGHIDSIKFIDGNNYDPTIAKFDVRGHEYLAVHGDYDGFSQSGISKLMLMVGKKPTGIFYGHLHHCSFDDIADVKIIRSGAFAGTVDDYTVSKRITGKPSQMVCVADETGIVCYYPVSLR